MSDNKIVMKAKYFDELSTKELYEILRARAEIFVRTEMCVPRSRWNRL